jgi:2-haloalkanoic acid dehalogenase type II
MAHLDIVTFDCYGTLIDWRGGIAYAFAQAGVSTDADAVLEAYGAIEPVVEAERYRPYRDVLRQTAIRIAREFGLNLSEDDASFLPDSLPSWKPFPDTNASLERLRAASLRLGILSNVDDELLAATRRHFTVDFDLIVTAQQVGSYKPAHGHFVTARERIGAARWLHAAQSDFHDIVPCNALGIENAWINRLREPALPGGTPTHEFPDLASFADWATKG